MPDVFISYSTSDSKFAEKIHNFLVAENITVFRSPISINSGEDWVDKIRDSLNDSELILFLASKKSIKSSFVQQELGGAFFGKKKVIPIIWEITPEKLPGWITKYQVLDIRNKTLEEIREDIVEIAKKIKISKRRALLTAVAIVGGLILVSGN